MALPTPRAAHPATAAGRPVALAALAALATLAATAPSQAAPSTAVTTTATAATVFPGGPLVERIGTICLSQGQHRLSLSGLPARMDA